MAKSFFETVKQTLQNSAELRRKARNGVERLLKLIPDLVRRSINRQQIMQGNPDRIIDRFKLKDMGKMVAFFYDPKWKKKLPYYDTFPLVIPIEMYPDGFLGLNMHYLPPGYRAVLMDELYKVFYNNETVTDKQRIQMTYNIIKRHVRIRHYIPCIKRYLYSHVRSRIYPLKGQDWDIALFLPTANWKKASEQQVWADSVKKIRGQK